MVRNRMHVMNWLWLACAVGGISGLEAGEPDFNVERAWQVNHDFERTALAGNSVVVDIIAGSIVVTGHTGSAIRARIDIHLIQDTIN